MSTPQTGFGGSNDSQWTSSNESAVRSPLAPAVGVTTEAAEEAPHRYGFTVGKFGLLMRPDCMSEVVKPPPIYPIPNTPPWLTGILNLRGNLVPVFDLALMLEQSVTYARALLLVIDRGEWAAGVKIDGFPQPLRLAPLQTPVPSLPPMLRDHVCAGYTGHGTEWLEFDHRGFFEAACQRIFYGSQEATGDTACA